MRIRQFISSTLGAAFVFAAHSVAQAGSAPSQDSDIVGIRLSMTKDQAAALIKQDFPGASLTPLPVTITLPTLQKDAVAGFIVNLVSKEDAAANQNNAEQAQADLDARKVNGFGDSPMNMKVGQVGDYAQDRLKVLFNPNDGTTDIFGIARYTEYPKGKQPVAQTLVSTLTEKYGPPSRSGGDNHTLLTFTWAAPGVLEKTRSSSTHCYDDAGFDLLYEDVGEGGYYGDRNMLMMTGTNFVRAINLIASKNPARNYTICGIVLQARLKLVNNGDYVGGMSVRLLDLSRAYAELNQFGASLAAQAQGARQQQLNRDSTNKPRL